MNTQPDVDAPKVSRRAALGSGLAVAAGTALATGMPALADKKRMSLPGGNVAYVLPEDHWANLVGETFSLVGFAYDDQTGRSRERLTLIETKVVVPGVYDKHRPGDLKRFAISLWFKGSGKTTLPEATYRIKHPWLGEFNLLLVNVRSLRHKKETIYEAFINN